MMKVHACKKCQGTLVLDKDEFGWYEECMQCGYTRDIPLDMPIKRSADDGLIPVAVVADTRNLAEKWKQNEIPSCQPILKLNSLEEDAY